MDLARFWRHVKMSPMTARRCFPEGTMRAIEREIAARESRHRGEICFLVEAELTTAQLWRGLGPRERARELFAAHGVWNTEENSGVLLYVLLADRSVEIVADRGIHARVPAEAWQAICRRVESHFREERYEAGALEGVGAVSDLLEAHFPGAGQGRDELSDRPRLL